MFRFWNPDVFQGSKTKRDYFEGWYYKLVSRDERTVLSIIPGISTAKGDAHAFIQVIRHTGRTAYVRYPLSRFTASQKLLFINIGENFFTSSGMTLNVHSPDVDLNGYLSFSDIIPFPKDRFRRGIMGPFDFIPFMECYHGIVNIHHRLTGSFKMDGEVLDFDGGTGYIEKDRGRSFPTAWIWFQSHFSESGATVMFSIADIPFLGRRFPGILAFLYFGGKYYPIATYNGASVKTFSLRDRGFSIALQNKRYAMYLDADYTECGLLKAPVKGLMKRDIGETLAAKSYVELKTIEGDILFQGKNEHTGLEICGDVARLFGSIKLLDS